MVRHSYQVNSFRDSVKVLKDIQEIIGHREGALTLATENRSDLPGPEEVQLNLDTLIDILEVMDNAPTKATIYTYASQANAVDSRDNGPGQHSGGRTGFRGHPSEC